MTAWNALHMVTWGAATVFSTLVLLYRWDHRPSRALGLAILAGGLLGVVFDLSLIEQDPGMARLWSRLLVVLLFAALFFGIYFISNYPRRRWLAARPWGNAALLAPLLPLAGLSVLAPEPFLGNTVILDGLLWVVAMSFSAIFLFDSLKAPAGPMRNATFLLGLGWLSGAFQHGIIWSFTLYGRAGDAPAYLNWAAGVVILYIFAHMVWVYVRRMPRDDPETRRRNWIFAVALVPATVGAVWTVFTHHAVSAQAAMTPMIYTDAIACAGGLLLIVYAAVKYQVLGIDLKVKWTIKQSTVAGAFIAVFFVASEGAQVLFAESAGLGPWIGIAGAGLLVFGLSPLQRVAERVANTAMPAPKPIAEMDADERHELYREQALFAWSDGQLSAKDRRILNVARERLGLTMEETTSLEEEAMARAVEVP